MAEPPSVSTLLPSQQNINTGCCGGALDKTVVLKIILVVLGIFALAGAITLGGWGQKLLPHIFTTTQQQIIAGSVLGTMGLCVELGVLVWQIQEAKSHADAVRDGFRNVQALNRLWCAAPHHGVEPKSVVFKKLQDCSFLFYGKNADYAAKKITSCISEAGEKWIDSVTSFLSTTPYEGALFFYPKVGEEGSISNQLLIFQMTVSEQKGQQLTLELDKTDAPLCTSPEPKSVELAEGIQVIVIQQDCTNKITLAILPDGS